MTRFKKRVIAHDSMAWPLMLGLELSDLERGGEAVLDGHLSVEGV